MLLFCLAYAMAFLTVTAVAFWIGEVSFFFVEEATSLLWVVVQSSW